MKKFLVLIVITVVIASLGLLTYNFITSNETLSISASTLYINKGEEVDIENYIVRGNPKNSTTISVSFDESLYGNLINRTIDEYTFSAGNNAGEVILVVNSNIRDFVPLTVTIRIGNGTETAPYYISTQNQLAEIGVNADFTNTSYYKLVNDITLSGDFAPICSTGEAFNGNFNFNNCTISNLTVNGNIANAGLFGKIGSSAIIRNGKLNNVTINGSFENVGSLAGYSEGEITNVVVNGAIINNTNESESACTGGLVGYSSGLIYKSEVNAFEEGNPSIIGSDVLNNTYMGLTGGLVGKVETKTVNSSKVIMCSVNGTSLLGGKVIGGLIAKNVGGEISDTYARISSIKAYKNDSVIGGLVGENDGTTKLDGTIPCPCAILNSYTVVENYVVNGLTGVVTDSLVGSNLDYTDLKKVNILYGLYYYVTSNNETIATSLTTSNFVFVNAIDIRTNNITADVLLSKELEIEGGNPVAKESSFSISIWNFAENEYPTINMEAGIPTISILRDGASLSVINDGSVASFTDAINDENVKVIELRSDVTISNSLGNLNKTINGNGYKIKASAKLSTSIFEKVSGTINNVVFDGIEIQSTGNTGVVASKLTGTISNCTFVNCKIENDAKAVKLGLVAGENNGTINNIVVYDNNFINYSGTLPEGEDKSIISSYIGFIAGYNTGSITNSIVYDGETVDHNVENGITNSKVCKVYIGGIAGGNEGSITKVEVGYGAKKVFKLISDNNFANTLSITGGVVGLNTGILNTAKVSGQFSVPCFGGIVGENVVTNTDASYIVTNCYVSDTMFASAMRAGALCYNLASGKMQYCETVGTLYGIQNDAIVCGFVHTLGYNVTNNAIVINCFSSTNLIGESAKFYQTQSVGWRGLLFGQVNTGYIDISPYNQDACVASRVDDSWIFDVARYALIVDAFEEYNKAEADCLGYKLQNDLGSTEIWVYSDGEYPQLKAVNNMDFTTLFSKAVENVNR